MTFLQRADYKNIWNALSHDIASARLHVGGTTDAAELASTTIHTLNVLRATVGVLPTDECFEIGCGVGRVGLGLAPLVSRWTGCDSSTNMVRHARVALAALPNAEVIETSGYDLQPLRDATFDFGYCTVVMMHLEGFDRFRYIREAWRVLKPGGRFFCDNTNLLTDDGWSQFQGYADGYHPNERPAHIGTCSTPQELEAYFRRAGFKNIQSRTRGLWVDVWAEK